MYPLQQVFLTRLTNYASLVEKQGKCFNLLELVFIFRAVAFGDVTSLVCYIECCAGKWASFSLDCNWKTIAIGKLFYFLVNCQLKLFYLLVNCQLKLFYLLLNCQPYPRLKLLNVLVNCQPNPRL